MAGKRFIIIFWVLLIGPALIVSGVAARLLLHEQERINRAALETLENKARSMALNVHTTVEAVEQRLTDALLELRAPDPKEDLLAWESSNPLVRNVFIWERDNLLLYPEKGMAATREEQAFTTRFEAIFTGQIPFDDNQNHGPIEARTEKLNVPDRQQSSPEVKSMTSARSVSEKEQLLDLASPKKAAPAVFREAGMAEPSVASGPFTGWIPWFSQNQLHILGWVQKRDGGPVYGIELELACLISRLIPDMPFERDSGVTWAVLDSRQQVVHQAGDVMVEEPGRSDIHVPLSTLLPHWQIAVYLDQGAFSPGRGFIIMSGLLLCIFMAAIISGGMLLSGQARRQMREAMQKTSFVSSVSHELKTPLTSIRMYAELLLAGRVAAEEKKKRYLEVMVAESQRLTRLINNVLDFGKLEQGRKTYQKSRINLEQMIQGIIDTHSIRMKNAGFEVHTRVSPGEYAVIIDPDALEQVVLNLVDNALKYAAEGRLISFELHEEPAEGVVILRICDNGPGVPRAHQKAIFNKFYRMDTSLTSSQPGSGLGLSIARQILQDLGGDLYYEARDQGGACFTARITKHDIH